jgi:hypothetical protein
MPSAAKAGFIQSITYGRKALPFSRARAFKYELKVAAFR